jgi:small-conductance mechanosensitive channel/CRP-like cAMP-binding protein
MAVPPIGQDGMAAPLIVMAALTGAVLLVGAGRVCRYRSLPRLPVLLPLLALLGWALSAVLPLATFPGPYRLGLGIVLDLLASYAAVRLLFWLLLELPGGLGWWRRPPDLLIQLLTISGWALISVLVVRETTQFDLVNLVATSAVLTAVIGLAAQEGLKDLFSGLQLQLTDDFAIGDWLELADGRRGTVEAISWRETRLRTMDGTFLVVPNSRITADVFLNRSRFGAIADRFEIALASAFPPGRAIPLLLQVVQQHDQVLSDPPAQVRLKAFHDSGIAYEVQIWQKPLGDQTLLELRSQLQQQIWYALQRQGQSLPYPVREILPKRSQAPNAMQDLPVAEGCRRALAMVPMFAGLGPEELQVLVEGSQLIWFGPGEVVVRQGDSGDSLYCLLQGLVDVSWALDGERQQQVRQLCAGDVFGEMTLFLDSPRTATVRTVGECQLLEVERAVVCRLLEGNPALLESMALLVSKRRTELEQLSLDPQGTTPMGLLEAMRRLFAAVRGG